VFYDASTNGEINKLFYNMKRRYYRELIDMCAERMKKSLLIAARTRQINLNDYVVTFAPRRDSNVIKYGFDQSEKLSKSLAKKLGLVHVATLENLGKREQKGLNKNERMQNAVSNYEYIDGSLKDYKNVIIVDDIMTSGATLYACAFLLFKNGATNVIPVAFAKDNYNAKGDKRNVKRNSKYNFTGAFKGFVRNGSQ
jgi:predicted amidophosphoribosyltransferase